MKLFLADANPEFIEETIPIYDNILISFHYISRSKKIVEYIRNGLFPRVKAGTSQFFVDSGAHSANTLGVKIDIQKYIEFLKENEKHITHYCGLDDIKDWKVTQANQKIMERAGLKPLITFHNGEPIALLKKYLDKYDMICLGGVVGKTRKHKIAWLDNLYARVISKYPKKKIHLFGVRDSRILLRYPLYSADASSHAQAARVGGTPLGHYSKLPKTVKGLQYAATEADTSLRAVDKAKNRLRGFIEETRKEQERITAIWKARGIVWNE